MSVHPFPNTDLCADCRYPIVDGERFKLTEHGPLCEICADLTAAPPPRTTLSDAMLGLLIGGLSGLLAGFAVGFVTAVVFP